MDIMKTLCEKLKIIKSFFYDLLSYISLKALLFFIIGLILAFDIIILFEFDRINYRLGFIEYVATLPCNQETIDASGLLQNE